MGRLHFREAAVFTCANDQSRRKGAISDPKTLALSWCCGRHDWIIFFPFPSAYSIPPPGSMPVRIISVRPLSSLCLCGEQSLMKIHHRGTERTEDAQRKLKLKVHPAPNKMDNLNTIAG